MRLILQLILLTGIIGLSCCQQEQREELILPQPVNYSTGNRTPLFNVKNTTFQLTTNGRELFIELGMHLNNYFPFPVNKIYHDTLRKANFSFSLLENGQAVLSDYGHLQNTLHWKKDSLLSPTPIRMESENLDLREEQTIQFTLPLYALHTLKKGKHALELRIEQGPFNDEVQRNDEKTGRSYSTIYESVSLLHASVYFDFDVPPIYFSYFIGQGLELRNDSTFSPAGMDNTIWNSSYPDIYWAIVYPKHSWYAQTGYQTSTDHYEGSDTFKLYRYTPDDSVGVAVYDHDNLSSDDFLGSWWGAAAELEGTTKKRIHFDNVRWFDAQISKAVLINP